MTRPTDITIYSCGYCDQHHAVFHAKYEQLDQNDVTLIEMLGEDNPHYNNIARLLLIENSKTVTAYLLAIRTEKADNLHDLDVVVGDINIVTSAKISGKHLPAETTLTVIEAQSGLSEKERFVWYQSEVARIEAHRLLKSINQ